MCRGKLGHSDKVYNLAAGIVAVVVDGFDSYPLGKLLELEKPAVEYL
jgi:hypothetical protein